MNGFPQTIALAIVAVAIGLFAAPPIASAVTLVGVASSGKKAVFSMAAYKRCGKKFRGWCDGLAVVVDPPLDGITELEIALEYDPTKWVFRLDLSGFLCDFSIAGGCPVANARVGAFTVLSLDDADFSVGAPLAGSTVSLDNDVANGLVTLDYILGQPLAAAGEQNFYSFFFDSVNSFSEQATIAYYSADGNYAFTQASARCTTVNGTCASDTPIGGFNIVPEPATPGLLALALIPLIWTRRASAIKRLVRS